MENGDLWAGLLGFFLPLLIAVIVRQAWDPGQKSLAAFGICIVAAVGTSYFAGKLSPSHADIDGMIRIALIVTTESIVFYKGLWRPTDIAPAIERHTG